MLGGWKESQKQNHPILLGWVHILHCKVHRFDHNKIGVSSLRHCLNIATPHPNMHGSIFCLEHMRTGPELNTVPLWIKRNPGLGVGESPVCGSIHIVLEPEALWKYWGTPVNLDMCQKRGTRQKVGLFLVGLPLKFPTGN